jgi:choline dehydrogenase/4-pyridoxate dehydrogenase
MIAAIGKQPALAPFITRQVLPGDDLSEAALDAHVARTGITVHHPAGTCKMGPAHDPGAVVDGAGRVHGVRNLRVVDASIMPDLVGGNINAAVIMIAEKIADAIIASKDADQPSPPTVQAVRPHADTTRNG